VGEISLEVSNSFEFLTINQICPAYMKYISYVQVHIDELFIGRYLAQITQLFAIQKEKFGGLAVLFVVQ